MAVTSDPYGDFECDGCENYDPWDPATQGYGEETVGGVTQSFVKFKANVQVDGDASNFFTLKFGGVKNPISFQATEVFNLETYDQSDYLIAKGPIDIVRMHEMSKFDQMTIDIENPVNGAESKYTITFGAKTRMVDGDIFNLLLPSTIKSPKEPTCSMEKCLSQIECTSERGKLIAQFAISDADCLVDDAEISFSVEGMTNAGSLVKSEAVEAYWTSKYYMKVCEYEGEDGPFYIQNGAPGEIETASISQASKDYAENNQYTIRFTPKNPIPKLGWISLVYPINVKIIDGDVTSIDDFLDGRGDIPAVEVYSSTSYSGSDYAFFDEDESKRTIYFHSTFMEQDSYTSEVAISFQMTNPQSNFFKDTSEMDDQEREEYEYDMSFHISTFTVDTINDFTTEAELTNMVSTVKGDPERYLFAIDTYPDNDIRPLLKCVAPCLTCLDAFPDYCLSCWGQYAGEDANGDPQENTKYFLQKKDGGQTCQEACDDKYTTNGESAGSGDDMYYECVECDMFCATCRGQGLPYQDPGSPYHGEIDLGQIPADHNNGEPKQRCITCDPVFPYLVSDEERCYVQCNAGYYEKVSNILEANAPPAECERCDDSEETRCETCSACDESDAKCKVDPFGIEAGAKFCTSCV